MKYAKVYVLIKCDYYVNYTKGDCRDYRFPEYRNQEILGVFKTYDDANKRGQELGLKPEEEYFESDVMYDMYLIREYKLGK